VESGGAGKNHLTNGSSELTDGSGKQIKDKSAGNIKFNCLNSI
jgi:hypothetical protein